jgi:hypothetical protein
MRCCLRLRALALEEHCGGLVAALEVRGEAAASALAMSNMRSHLRQYLSIWHGHTLSVVRARLLRTFYCWRRSVPPPFIVVSAVIRNERGILVNMSGYRYSRVFAAKSTLDAPILRGS